jgi:hypothetical protein
MDSQRQVFQLIDQTPGLINLKTRAMLACAFPGSVDKKFLQHDHRMTVLRAKFRNALKYWTARRLRVINRYARQIPDFSSVESGEVLVYAGFPSFIHGYLVMREPVNDHEIVQRMRNGTSESRSWPHPMDKFDHTDFAIWQTYYLLIAEYAAGRVPDPHVIFNTLNSKTTRELGGMGW